MSEKAQQFPYVDEDILFLVLKLLDYPNGRQRTYDFRALQSLNLKKPILERAFRTLSDINKLCRMQLDQFEFDKYDAHFSEKSPMQNHISSLIYHDKTEKYATLKKVLQKNFDFSDLEALDEKYPAFLFELIRSINFRITITEEIAKEILKRIRMYTALFKKNNLIRTEINYLDFENHRKLFERKVSENFERTGKTAVFSDNEFPDEFLLIYCVLALEEEGDIEIKNVSSKMIGKHVYYFVSIEMKNRLLKRIGKSVVRESLKPSYTVKGKILFFLPDGKEKSAIKIGRENSQKARLLRCLLENFGVARKIDAVYESIRPKDLDVSTRNYGNEKNPEKVIKQVIKELQRGGNLKGFVIETTAINGKNNAVRLIHSG